jgi:hypothetical protein
MVSGPFQDLLGNLLSGQRYRTTLRMSSPRHEGCVKSHALNEIRPEHEFISECNPHLTNRSCKNELGRPRELSSVGMDNA